MKAVILAGGYGTRLSEETVVKPKPMVEIGGRPILWHIMKYYWVHGVDEFIICLGYKGEQIKEYFLNYRYQSADISIDLRSDEVSIASNSIEPWRIHLIDTGEKTMTGGRLRRVRHLLADGEPFFMTYGDGLADADLGDELRFHQSKPGEATVLAVQPPGRFGAFELRAGEDRLPSFREKPDGDGAWISGGYFVLEPGVIDYIDGDETVWEREPMERLAAEGNLMAYRHQGFWQPMDTLRDKEYLESLWASGRAPWCKWSDGPVPTDRRAQSLSSTDRPVR